LHKIYFIS